MLLTNDWTIVASVEGGEILAKAEESRGVASFPSSVSSSELEEILKDKEIDFDEWTAQYHAGESEGETIATWAI